MLEGDAITPFRSGVARCNYLSVDRPDMPFEPKELCRSMSKPTELDIMVLKHPCRHLKGRPRLVQRIPSRVIPAWGCVSSLTAIGLDAAEPVSPPTGVVCSSTVPCLKTWSTTQAVSAISSAEAEYYAALKGSTMALGFRSMAADLTNISRSYSAAIARWHWASLVNKA